MALPDPRLSDEHLKEIEQAFENIPEDWTVFGMGKAMLAELGVLREERDRAVADLREICDIVSDPDRPGMEGSLDKLNELALKCRYIERRLSAGSSPQPADHPATHASTTHPPS